MRKYGRPYSNGRTDKHNIYGVFMKNQLRNKMCIVKPAFPYYAVKFYLEPKSNDVYYVKLRLHVTIVPNQFTNTSIERAHTQLPQLMLSLTTTL